MFDTLTLRGHLGTPSQSSTVFLKILPIHQISLAKHPQKGPLKNSRPLDFFGIEGQIFGMILENKVVQK